MGVAAWLFGSLLVFLIGACFGILTMLALLILWSGVRLSPAPRDINKEATFPAIGVSQHLKDRLPHTVLPARNLHTVISEASSLLGRASGVLLRVRVIEGKDLLPTDAAKTRANSMVVVRFMGQSAKTKLVKRSLAPRWDFAAHLPAGETAAVEGAEVEFELCSTSRKLGIATLRLSGLVRGKELATWLPLTGLAQTDYGLVRAKGSISIAVELLDAQGGSVGGGASTHTLVVTNSLRDSTTSMNSSLSASMASLPSSPSSTSVPRTISGSALNSSTSSLRDSGDFDRERAAEQRREQMLSVTVHERAKEAARALAKLPAAMREQSEKQYSGWLQVAAKDWVEYWCVLERKGTLRLQADEAHENLAAIISLADCDIRRKKTGFGFEIRQRSRRNILELYSASLDKPQERAKRPHVPSKPLYKLAFRTREEPQVEKWMREITGVLPNATPPLFTSTGEESSAPADASSISALQKQVAEEEKKLDLGDDGVASGPLLGVVPAGMVQAIDALREVKAIDAKWASSLFNRVFRELNCSKIFLNGISRQIRRALKNIHHEILGPVVLQQLELGKQFLSVSKIRCAGAVKGRADEMLLEIEVEYPGGFAVSLSTEVYVNIPRPRSATIPVQLHVSLNYLAGRLCLYAPSILTERYELFFNGAPTFNPNVRVEVGDKQRQLLTGTLRNFVYSAVNKALAGVLVAPNSIGFFLPYPGKDPSAKMNVRTKRASASERSGISSASAPVLTTQAQMRKNSMNKERDPTIPPGLEHTQSEISPPSLSRGVTELAMKIGPSKNPDEKPETHAKKYLVARYFDELLNRGEYQVVVDLFTPHCIVHGSTAKLDQDIIGHEALLDMLQELHRALPGALFLLDDVAVDGDYVFTRWRARGTIMCAPFPALAGLVDGANNTGEVLMSGFSIHRVGHGNQRIQEQWHFWAAPSLRFLLV